jgi:competence protein ComFC
MSYPGPPSPTTAQRLWRQLRERLLDLVYPRICRSCEVVLPGDAPHSGLENWLCEACRQRLAPVEAPCCAVCGEPFSGAMERPFKCSNCEGRRLAFEFAIAGYRASGPLRELIHRFKYSGDLTLRGVLADALMRALEDPRLAAENLGGWVLVPVPLHAWRQMRRQFNQSWELCRELSLRTGIPAVQVLRRRRATTAQARLSRKRRLENLRGVFGLRRELPLPGWRRPDLKGRNVLLVDDVLTTGTTTHECARVLRREAGVQKVVVITVARG